VTTYIISMTHGVSDILEVLLLAKEAGLLRWISRDGKLSLESDLDVVPLFETIEDLEACDVLMRQLFADAAYRAQLDARGRFQETRTAARTVDFSRRTGRRTQRNRVSRKLAAARGCRCGSFTAGAEPSDAAAVVRIARSCRSLRAASMAASALPNRAK
jgi:hypothetical protein